MDTCEASKIVFSRIQALDPDNASKTIGYILWQDPGEDVMIRFALGTDTFLLSLINHAKTQLGLSSNTLSASRLPESSPNGFYFHPPSSSPWSISGFSDQMSSISTHLQEQLSFLQDSSSNNVDFADRAISPGGFDWKPCVYYARGFCKFGSKCKFMHGRGFSVSSAYPRNLHGFDELLRMKAIQHHRHGKYGINCNLNDSPRLGGAAAAAATSLKMEEDFLKFGIANSICRQIYLTFPEDSMFKEDDVSAYFSSKFGPVQDVRIPHQKKRMFGFVTFVYPETVEMILAQGNPHFVCDSRVLVKPYKEKERNSDKNQHDYSHCLSLSAHDFPIGGRMVYDPQEILLRRKLEERAELQQQQQAIEFHGRRLMNLHLIAPQFNPNLSPMIPIPHSLQKLHIMNQPLTFRHDPHFNNDNKLEENSSSLAAIGPPPKEDDQQTQCVMREVKLYDNANGGKQPSYLEKESLPESIKFILPDNLFSSPTKVVAENHSSMF